MGRIVRPGVKPPGPKFEKVGCSGKHTPFSGPGVLSPRREIQKQDGGDGPKVENKMSAVLALNM